MKRDICDLDYASIITCKFNLFYNYNFPVLWQIFILIYEY